MPGSQGLGRWEAEDGTERLNARFLTAGAERLGRRLSCDVRTGTVGAAVGLLAWFGPGLVGARAADDDPAFSSLIRKGLPGMP